jgi:hypothetical protein
VSASAAGAGRRVVRDLAPVVAILGAMRLPLAVLVVLSALAAPALAREPHRPLGEVRARMEHHLREVSLIADHFENVMSAGCPRFPSPVEWRTYLDGEIDRVVLLMAHLEQAWVEAKGTGDDDVRREAKAPRRRVDQARALFDKLSGCAERNGDAPFSQMAVWRRIEREVPQRQVEIALPE